MRFHGNHNGVDVRKRARIGRDAHVDGRFTRDAKAACGERRGRVRVAREDRYGRNARE
jgi:hypothetical protein